ncbi:MAG: ABC transporter permease [Christensenellales bacterium]|jgi:ABC-2 type transport system permease protein
MLAVWKRELKQYFLTPMGSVLVGTFLLLGGAFFYVYNILSGSSDLSSMFGSMNYIFMLIAPFYTMRLLSEERRTKTDQLLLTSPVTITSIVLGKFLAACSVLLISLVPTLVYVAVIVSYATPYPGMIISNYIGFILIGCSYLSIGVLMSSLTENQLSAAALTFAANLILMLLEMIGPNISLPYMSWLTTAISWLSLYKRYNSFMAGYISVAGILYYMSFCGIMLFLTIRVIDKRRWSEG